MSWNQDQGQTGGEQDPYSGYGTPQNPYGTPPPQNPYQNPQNPQSSQNPQNPQNPYGAPPPAENPYGNPQNPYGAPPTPENPYAPQNPYGGTNYGNYQQGQQGYGYEQPAATPLPLGQAIQQLPNEYLKVLTHPSPQTFAEEIGKANWPIVWVQLIGYAVIASILGGLARLISPTSLGTTTGSGFSAAQITAVEAGASIGAIIVVPIVFFIGMGILYGLSKAFGGQGTFLRQSYATLLFQVPLGILTALIGLIPIAGGFIGLAIEIYAIVLQIFAIMAVHRLSGGKATAVVLIPVAVLFLLICGLIVLLIAIIASAAKGAGY